LSFIGIIFFSNKKDQVCGCQIICANGLSP